MFTSRLGDFIRVSKTPDGEGRVTYIVPDDQRPEHWAQVRPLPALGKPTGDLNSPAFREKVEQSIRKYDQQLEIYWQRQGVIEEFKDRSARTLGKLYRVETRIRYPYSALLPQSQKQNDRYIRMFAEWADENGAPSMATITQDAIIDYLDLYDEDGSQRVLAKSVLNHLMKTAVLVGCRTDNPVRDIRVKDPESEPRDFWTAEDVERYREAAIQIGHPAIGALIQFMFETGQRPSDARVME